MNKDDTDFKSWFDALTQKVAESGGEQLNYSDEVLQAFDDGKTVEAYAKTLTAKKR